MALPHLGQYTTRKNIYEAVIVQKRNKDNDFKQQWSDNAKYFNNYNVTTTKQRAWESDVSFHNSMDAYKAQQERETKALNLQRRRLKLAQFLKKERAEYEAQLTGVTKGNFKTLEEMKDRSDNLRSARESQRQQFAEEKLEEHWRLNNPDLRRLESAQHQKHVIQGWSGQVDEKKKKQEEERLQRERLEKELEEQRQLALELERKQAEEKKSEEVQLKGMLKRQMDELKARDLEAGRLKAEQDQLMQRQWELDKLEEQRRQMEREHQKKEQGRILLRQHTAALRKKSKDVQKELEEERRFLEGLIRQEKEERQLVTSRKEKAQADAKWMKQVIDEQIKLEKAREAELDMLYQDEAARIWQQRDAEWAKERAARDRLMREVLLERQDQVASKMAQVRQEQEESLERREELLQDLEMANQLTRREERDREQAKTQRKNEIQAQITARREKDTQLRLELEEEVHADQRAEQDYEEMLRREAQRMDIRGFQEKDFGRRQAWM